MKTFWTEWARGKAHVAFGAVALVAACSFQDFEYLQEPEEDPLGGSGGSSSGGSSGDDSGGGTSGTPTGGKGGSAPSGGMGGVTGGAGGSAGTTAGDGGEGGEATGGTSSGGTNTGGTSTGGKGGSGGTGAVGELVNPSFETNSTMGWTMDPPEALTNRWMYTQAPTGAVAAPDGSYELASWHGTTAYQVELSQQVKGLEDGTYTFSGYFSWGLMINELYLFARNCGGTDPDPMPVPTTPPDSFVLVSLEGIDVVGGNCEVGLYVDGSINAWMNADNFTLVPE